MRNFNSALLARAQLEHYANILADAYNLAWNLEELPLMVGSNVTITGLSVTFVPKGSVITPPTNISLMPEQNDTDAEEATGNHE